jgi:hypothetical protein
MRVGRKECMVQPVKPLIGLVFARDASFCRMIEIVLAEKKRLAKAICRLDLRTGSPQRCTSKRFGA